MPEKMKNRRQIENTTQVMSIPQFSCNSTFSSLRQETLYLSISAKICKTQQVSGHFSNKFYLNVILLFLYLHYL
jgi:hypothetical protein